MSIKIVSLFTMLLLSAFSVAGQAYRGSIRGTVTDLNHAVIVGATVSLAANETNEERTNITNATGEYTISSLPPGAYKLTISAPGFQSFIHDLVLYVNQETRIDVTMTVGTVLADPDFIAFYPGDLKKDSASLGTVIDNRQIVGLPLDGRNFYELTLLVPAAFPAAPGSAGSARGDFAFSVNGAREDANNFLLDCVYNLDPKLNTFGVRPPVDAIKEFETLTSSYDAAFGRGPGAQVNVVLKAGTNAVHGSLFEFHRNGKLDARNFFAPPSEPKPKYIRNQFGGSLGGPIRRDRTFFFGDYEGTRSREGITRTTNVPTAQERAGDFSHTLFGVPIDPFTRLPVPGDVIPNFRINAVGRALAALYPLPNRNVPLQNFVSSPTQRDRNDSFDARLDQIIGQRMNLMFRYSFGDRNLFEPFTGPSFALVPGFGDTVKRRSQNIMAGLTHVIGPNLVNETRIALSRVASSVTQEASRRNADLGLPVISPNARDAGLSFITVTGLFPLGDEGNNPQK